MGGVGLGLFFIDSLGWPVEFISEILQIAPRAHK